MTGWTLFFLTLGISTVVSKALDVLEHFCN